ncbi:MAG: hypothetical protein LBV48_01755 [Mycoplasmataceae bacterium]|jgi:hypothetical protein|nr:hypothetical protein [Mycoplasmataceae bacterium]
MTKTLRIVSLCAILPLAVLPVCFSIVSCGENYISAHVWLQDTDLEGDENIQTPTPHVWNTEPMRLSKAGIVSKISIWYSSSFTDFHDGFYNRSWSISYDKNYPYTLDATGFLYVYEIVENGVGAFYDYYYTFKAVK